MGVVPRDEDAAGLSREQAAAVQTELNAILRSSHFSASKRCQDFLEFIVRQASEGNYSQLTERFLGAELFGRPIDYETASDSIVRVRANDVRRRLAQYYADGHEVPKVKIGLVSGSYVPEFTWQPAKVPQLSPVADSPEAAHVHSEALANTRESHHGARETPRFWWISIGAVALLVIGCCLGWWLSARALDHSLEAWKYEHSLSTLWSGVLDTDHDTDVVLSDASFQVIQDISRKAFSLNDYLSRSYVGQLRAPAPDLDPTLKLLTSKSFGSSSEFRLAQRFSELDRMGNRVRIYNARDYSSNLEARDNLILIGSPYSNPWQQLFEPQLNYVENPPDVSPGTIINRAPKPGEPSKYVPSDSVGYCVVAYLPNPDRNTKVLLIQGSSSEATEAGGDFLLSRDKLSKFETQLHAGRLPYFEVLLKTTQARGTPITATVESYRIYGQP